MAMLNINRQTNDMFYRYKMPKLVAKVEGTGNGIKTVLVNVTDVAKALHRPPTCTSMGHSQLFIAPHPLVSRCDKILRL
jgi:hypothetical protein